MPDFLGQIGSFFGSPAGKGLGEVAGLGATGAGLVGNLLADQQRSAAAKQAQANMNLTPQQLASMVSSATQPLNRGLVQAITNTTNANLAEQGLSQAPGLIATTEAQALAPFEQQNQNTALQLVLQKLGLPQSFAATIPPNAQLAPLLAMLFKNFGGSGNAGPGTFATTGPNLTQLSPPPDSGTYGDTPFDISNIGGIQS